MTSVRNVMLRYTLDLSKHWQVALAAEAPSVTYTLSDGNNMAIRQRMPDIPFYVQYEMCIRDSLQLVHVLGESVLELFKFFLVYPVCLAHQVETEPVFHRPCLADTVLQFFRRYEFLRVVSLHLDICLLYTSRVRHRETEPGCL